jgi:serine/threonine protein kinase
MSRIGPKTAEAVLGLARTLNSQPLTRGDDFLRLLADLLRDWPDQEAAAVLNAISTRVETGEPVDTESLARWIRVHHHDAASVRDCLLVEPPSEIDILRLLSRAGSQKLVFLAKWQLAQRDVVLKKFLATQSMERVFPRELQPHPLSMSHPNIIETHLLKNDKGEPFLAERRLPLVLSDDWSSHGIQEAANLLRDIASALAFLHEKGLIHGDVKPDNIGCENNLYILLDFGICRPEDAFAEDTTPTGSLRTRAPELIVAGRDKHSKASDVWALGATVFNAITGRFPLFDQGETPPRVSKPEDRDAFIAVLSGRVEREWEQRVDCALVPEPLRGLLANVLKRNPNERPAAHRIVRVAETELSALLRHRAGATIFSPTEEIEQLNRFLPSKDVLELMPDSQRQVLQEQLKRLADAKGLTDDQKATLESLRVGIT